ncbi:MAG: hypothetical protein WKF67_08770 [Rubrobacteraceae bacterium]
MIALPEDAVWSLGLGELFGGLYVFGDGSVRESRGPGEAFSYRGALLI